MLIDAPPCKLELLAFAGDASPRIFSTISNRALAEMGGGGV
jgi:hypothetical protein